MTNIAATIIADGALMNANAPAAGNTPTPINWYDPHFQLGKTLKIDGQLLTYNTRGGSLQAAGTALSPIVAYETGKCVVKNTTTGVSEITTCGNLSTARAQDLERFRVTPSNSGPCTLQVTGRAPALVLPILQGARL